MIDRLSLDWLLMYKGFEQGNQQPIGHKVQTLVVYLFTPCKLHVREWCILLLKSLV